MFFELAQDMLLAAVAAVGFALVFNVPARLLGYCAFLGALGHGFRFILLRYDLVSIDWGTLFASMLIGTLSIIFSRRFLAHPKVVSVAAVIPMFPGVSVYTSIIALLNLYLYGYSPERMELWVTHFLKGSILIGALSLGLTLPGIWIYRRRPSV